MKRSLIYLFILCINYLAVAHQPNISSLMIYQQNGKPLLIIKSSLSAFEGEIDYTKGKNAYKTPKEFQDLVIRHFEKNCTVKIDNQVIRLNNPYVGLGHETTVFAELADFPDKFSEIHIENTMFKDMPSNICEVIITLTNLPQKQQILTNDNKQQVTLKLMNQQWQMSESSNSLGKKFWVIMGCLITALILIIGRAIFKNNKKVNYIFHN